MRHPEAAWLAILEGLAVVLTLACLVWRWGPWTGTVAPTAANQDSAPVIEPTQARGEAAAWAALDAATQARIRTGRAAFLALPAAEQQARQARFAALDGAEQRGYLLGPELGAAWPQLQPLFGWVDEGQREAVLAMLHGLSPGDLGALGRIAWRAPPEDRERLRDELLRTPAAQRGAWIVREAER